MIRRTFLGGLAAVLCPWAFPKPEPFDGTFRQGDKVSITVTGGQLDLHVSDGVVIESVYITGGEVNTQFGHRSPDYIDPANWPGGRVPLRNETVLFPRMPTETL